MKTIKTRKKGNTFKSLFLFCIVTLCAVLTACQDNRTTNNRQGMIPVSLTGIDHLADHLSIQDFWVDGINGAQAGTGGSVVCCGILPNRWSPDLTVVVKWGITNWRDCSWELHERRVPVDRYEDVGALYIHFLVDGSVRAVSSNIAPGYGNPDYIGPHDPIPSAKRPYNQYGDWGGRCPVSAPAAFIETLDSI